MEVSMKKHRRWWRKFLKQYREYYNVSDPTARSYPESCPRFLQS
jgi:hypothetical protein